MTQAFEGALVDVMPMGTLLQGWDPNQQRNVSFPFPVAQVPESDQEVVTAVSDTAKVLSKVFTGYSADGDFDPFTLVADVTNQMGFIDVTIGMYCVDDGVYFTFTRRIRYFCVDGDLNIVGTDTIGTDIVDEGTLELTINVTSDSTNIKIGFDEFGLETHLVIKVEHTYRRMA